VRVAAAASCIQSYVEGVEMRMLALKIFSKLRLLGIGR
jgi:hypothetical protein